MKKNILYILLIALLFQSFSNLWIISSFYINQDYISKNLCINRFDTIPVCNGRCFLNKQLKKNDAENQKIPNIKEKEIQLYFYHQNHTSYYFKTSVETKKSIVIKNQHHIKQAYLSAIFRPPKTV